MRFIAGPVFSKLSDYSLEQYNYFRSLLTFEDGLAVPKTLISEDKIYTGIALFLARSQSDTYFQDNNDHSFSKEIKSDILRGVSLRDYQISAVRKSVHFKRGIIQSPTASGKTIMIAATIQHLRNEGVEGNIVCIVPNVFLAQQMHKDFLSLGLKDVAYCGGGKKLRKNTDIGIFVSNSALSSIRRGCDSFIQDAEVLILEEAHHASSSGWIEVCESCNANIRLAFTATASSNPEKYSYVDMILIGLTGPVLFDIRSKELRNRGYLASPVVTMIPIGGFARSWSWKTVYDMGVVKNLARNSIIVSLAYSIYKGNYKVLIFVTRKSHGHLICKSLAMLGTDSVFVHGGSTAHLYSSSSKKTVRWGINDIKEYVSTNERCIMVVTSALDEGIDIPSVNVLIMGAGMKKYRRTIQRIGRGMRPKDGDNKVYLFDFLDKSHSFLIGHSNYRVWTYQQEEYEFSDSFDKTREMMKCNFLVSKDLLRGVS